MKKLNQVVSILKEHGLLVGHYEDVAVQKDRVLVRILKNGVYTSLSIVERNGALSIYNPLEDTQMSGLYNWFSYNGWTHGLSVEQVCHYCLAYVPKKQLAKAYALA